VCSSSICPCSVTQVVMAQCRFALVPDGLFLCAMFGGDTLQVGAVYLYSTASYLHLL
jgi:hypothetical protein